MRRKTGGILSKRWFYPLVYFLLFLLNTVIPPHASKGYSWEETGEVIQSLLMVSIEPHARLAPVFHIATVILLLFIWRYGERANRTFSACIGANYIFIAFTQVMGTTEEYGLVIMTGSFLTFVLIGLLWFWEAFSPKNDTAFTRLPLARYWAIPLAFLAFWSPLNFSNGWKLNFDPLLLLTSPGYGLTFCMTTPVILCLLTLFYPGVNGSLFRINSFVGIIYGLLNMQFLSSPQTLWMGVLHFPLLLISIYAFVLPYLGGKANDKGDRG